MVEEAFLLHGHFGVEALGIGGITRELGVAQGQGCINHDKCDQQDNRAGTPCIRPGQLFNTVRRCQNKKQLESHAGPKERFRRDWQSFSCVRGRYLGIAAQVAVIRDEHDE